MQDVINVRLVCKMVCPNQRHHGPRLLQTGVDQQYVGKVVGLLCEQKGSKQYISLNFLRRYNKIWGR